MNLKPGDTIIYDPNYKCEKLLRNDKIAILLSPGYGGGWYSWTNEKNIGCLFDPHIVYMLEDLGEDPGKKQMNEFAAEVEKYIEKKYVDFYGGGSDQLIVKWIRQGTLFKIKEYDGNESIEFLYDNVIVA